MSPATQGQRGGNANSGRGGKAKARNDALDVENGVLVVDWDVPELKPEALAYWNEVYPHVRGIVKPHDRRAFIRLCRLQGRYEEIEAFLDKNGRTYESKTERSGAPRHLPRPEVKEQEQILVHIEKLEKRLGLAEGAADQSKPKSRLGNWLGQ